MTVNLFSPSPISPSLEELQTELRIALSGLSGSGWDIMNLAHRMVREKGLAASDMQAAEKAHAIVDALLRFVADDAQAAKTDADDLFSTAEARAQGAMESAGISSRADVRLYLPRVLALMREQASSVVPALLNAQQPASLGPTARGVLVAASRRTRSRQSGVMGVQTAAIPPRESLWYLREK